MPCASGSVSGNGPKKTDQFFGIVFHASAKVSPNQEVTMLNSRTILPLLRRGYPVALCIALLCAGCDSVDVSSPSSPQAVDQSHSVPAPEAIAFANGRLVFSGQEEFDAFMDALVEEPNHDDLEIVGLDPDFVSLETMQDLWAQEAERREMESESDQDISDLPETERIVEDPLFARVLNHDGQIQIGDTVYKVTYDYVYATAYGADDVLDAIPLKGSALSFKGNSSVEVYPVIRYKTDIFSGAIGKSQGAMGNGDCKSTFSNNHKRRIKGEIWANSWTFYNPVGSEIEAQTRRLFGLFWTQTRISWLAMTITGHVERVEVETFTYGGVTYTDSVTYRESINDYRSKSDAREIRATHYNRTDWNEVDLDGYFEGTYSGENQSCSSSFFKSK